MIPSYCYERARDNLKAIEKLKGYRDIINSFNQTIILDIKPVMNGLTYEIKIDRENLLKINGKDTLELFADNLQVAFKNTDITHNLIEDIDSLTREFVRAALEQFYECAGG